MPKLYNTTRNAKKKIPDRMNMLDVKENIYEAPMNLLQHSDYLSVQ